MSRTIKLLCGVSGVGKTYARTHIDCLKSLPFADVADHYKAAGGDVSDWLRIHNNLFWQVEELFQTRNRVVVVEGYYLPRSTTRRLLAGHFADVDIESWFFHAPLDVCKTSIMDGNIKARLELLDKLWRQADGIWRQKYDPVSKREYRIATRRAL